MLNASSNETAGDVRSSWRSIDWLSAYPPGASKDLAVHAAKVSAVKKWITDATAEHAAFEQNRSSHLCSDDCFRPYVLVLCGRSGCGKSTMVEVLCRELNVEVAQWSDDMIDVDSVQKGAPWDRPTLPTPTLAGSMAEWARGVTFPSLDIRSTGVSAESTEKEKFGIGRRFAYKNHRESKTLSKLILMHSPPFQNSKRSGSDDCGDLLQSVAFPVVIVLSEVGGADDMAFAADRALGLSPAQKNRLNLQVVYCNPITALKTAKVLNHVMLCVQKDCASSSRSERNAKSRLPYRPRVDEIDDIAQSSLGDVRHAIVQLQMMCICKSDYDSVRNKKTPNPTNRTALQAESNTLGYRNRDESFSSLHGVGKLLRLQQGIDGQFEVPIDSIMERSDFPLDMSIAFMQYHCIESLYRSSGVVIGDEKNLADIALLEDIGFALDTYVDAGIFWDKQYTVNSNLLEHSGTCLNTESYPIGYAVSLASRSAGVARGLPSRSWTESARFQGWQTSRLKIESSNVIDLSADVINTNKSLYESNHEDSEDNIVEPKRKWPRSEGANQIKAASKGGFLKLTRPKVLDLWRSVRRSTEKIAYLRNELIFVQPMKSLSFGGSFSEIPALRNRLDTKELCVTLIPLLRIMLEISDHKLPGSNTDLALQSIAHLRHRMISLFGEKSSLSSDTHPQSKNDLLENEMTFNLSHPLNSNPVHTIVNEILLMDDIEEY